MDRPKRSTRNSQVAAQPIENVDTIAMETVESLVFAVDVNERHANFISDVKAVQQKRSTRRMADVMKEANWYMIATRAAREYPLFTSLKRRHRSTSFASTRNEPSTSRETPKNNAGGQEPLTKRAKAAAAKKRQADARQAKKLKAEQEAAAAASEAALAKQEVETNKDGQETDQKEQTIENKPADLVVSPSAKMDITKKQEETSNQIEEAMEVSDVVLATEAAPVLEDARVTEENEVSDYLALEHAPVLEAEMTTDEPPVLETETSSEMPPVLDASQNLPEENFENSVICQEEKSEDSKTENAKVMVSAPECEVTQESGVTQEPEVAQEFGKTQKKEVSQKNKLTQESEIIQESKVAQESEINQKQEVNQKNEVTQKPEAVQESKVTQESEVTQKNEVAQETQKTQELEVSQESGAIKESEVTQELEVTQKPMETQGSGEELHSVDKIVAVSVESVNTVNAVGEELKVNAKVNETEAVKKPQDSPRTRMSKSAKNRSKRKQARNRQQASMHESEFGSGANGQFSFYQYAQQPQQRYFYNKLFSQKHGYDDDEEYPRFQGYAAFHSPPIKTDTKKNVVEEPKKTENEPEKQEKSSPVTVHTNNTLSMLARDYESNESSPEYQCEPSTSTGVGKKMTQDEVFEEALAAHQEQQKLSPSHRWD